MEGLSEKTNRTHRHKQQFGDSERERGGGRWTWVKGGKWGWKETWLWVHDAVCRRCFELYT